MKFSLKAMLAIVTFICTVSAVFHNLSIEILRHRANFGVLRIHWQDLSYHVDMIPWTPLLAFAVYLARRAWRSEMQLEPGVFRPLLQSLRSGAEG